MAETTNSSETESLNEAAAEALRKRMLRLMIISVGTMFIGIFAVLFAIVYKINDVPNAATDIQVSLPDGFVIDDVEIDGDVLMFRGAGADQSTTILLFDATTGQARRSIVVK